MLHNGCSPQNFARNSIQSPSEFEVRTLKFRAFWGLANLWCLGITCEIARYLSVVEEVELVGCCAGRAVLDPVVGDALRTVGHRYRSTFAESKGVKRAPHRDIVLVGVAAQVIRVLSRELEDNPSDTTPAHRGYAVNHVVVGVGVPRAIDRRVGLVWPGSERKDGERPLVVGHNETVSVRDVFLSVNAARISVGPLSRIPVRLHERTGLRIRTLDKLEVLKEGDLNLHLTMIGGVGGAPDEWRRGSTRWRVNPLGGSAGGAPRLSTMGLTCALRG